MNFEFAYKALRQMLDDLTRPKGISNSINPRSGEIKDFMDLRNVHISQMIKEFGDDPYKG